MYRVAQLFGTVERSMCDQVDGLFERSKVTMCEYRFTQALPLSQSDMQGAISEINKQVLT